MAWLFRRRSAGRHSLGAAVTSIPTATPAVALPPVAALPPVVALPPVPVDAGPPRPLVPSAVPFVPPPRQDPAVLAIAPPVQPPVPALPPVPPVQAPALLPVEPPASVQVVRPSATGPRVELGFTDGTFRTLDPASSQARALEELARSLRAPG